MSEAQKKILEQQLWNIANTLRGKMNADEFRDYIRISTKDGNDKASIFNDIDFELELIRRDTINVSYILQLLIIFKSGACF